MCFPVEPIRLAGFYFGCLWKNRSGKYSLIRMSSEKPEGSSGGDLLKNSSLYREFQAEREEILKHKWIESEKMGHDIGFERALTDWIMKHRSKWRKSRQHASEA